MSYKVHIYNVIFIWIEFGGDVLNNVITPFLT